MAKLIWYLVAFTLTACILLNNPKANNVGFNSNFTGSSRLKKNVNTVTWVSSLIFIVITVYLSILENN
uniref:preprotein translocase subunit G n=1 Tax=Erythrolobus coxiae TaxID=362235 RepID=UPI001FCD7F64|nr:preprotein translocase subunit G [Erythrolobus coxiae]UNJ17784.1 preprotein translocase subunit G [Erythrolobus coxiae]